MTTPSSNAGSVLPPYASPAMINGRARIPLATPTALDQRTGLTGFTDAESLRR